MVVRIFAGALRFSVRCPPVGLSTTIGGLSWEVFNIDGDYQSLGLAWGNGRFVSVGQEPRFPSQGAIYTAERNVAVLTVVAGLESVFCEAGWIHSIQTK